MKKPIIISFILFSAFFVFRSVVAISVDKKLYNFSKKKFFLEKIKEVVEKRGASVNYQSYEGHTPLMKAAFRGDEALVKYFLSKGAVAKLENRHGQIALHKAAQGGHLGIVKLLVKHNAAGVNKQDKDGNTPLHKAAKENRSKVSRYLVRKGASVSIKNKKGKTPDKLIRDTKTATFLKKEADKPKIK